MHKLFLFLYFFVVYVLKLKKNIAAYFDDLFSIRWQIFSRLDFVFHEKRRLLSVIH
jgi:hypothetical protein